MQASGARSFSRAVDSSREALRLSLIQYKNGFATYLQVIETERTLLANELSAANAINQQFTATVLLIKALGGGWDSTAASQPTP